MNFQLVQLHTEVEEDAIIKKLWLKSNQIKILTKKKKQGNIRLNAGVARTGLNLDSSIDQVGPGRLTYALNAAVENFDSSSVNYQNEPGNEFCLVFTPGYRLIGEHFIPEKK